MAAVFRVKSAVYPIIFDGLVSVMGRWRRGSFVICVVLFLTGCSAENRTQKALSEPDILSAEREIFAMNTYMTLKAYGEQPEAAFDDAVAEINRLDGIFNSENRESEVYILNNNGSEVLSEDSAALMEKARDLSDSTQGAFDITIYPLMEEWGFTNPKYQVPSDPRIKKLLGTVGNEKIKYEAKEKLAEIPEGVKMDFGGIAKGYTSGRVMDIFRDHNLSGGVVSLGGNVQVMGSKSEHSDWKEISSYIKSDYRISS